MSGNGLPRIQVIQKDRHRYYPPRPPKLYNFEKEMARQPRPGRSVARVLACFDVAALRKEQEQPTILPTTKGRFTEEQKDDLVTLEADDDERWEDPR